MSNKDDIEKHNAAWSGNNMNTAGLAIDQFITLQRENRKKRLTDEFTEAVDSFLNAYNRLMDRFDREMEALDQALLQLQYQIHENRAQWQRQAHFLNDIDDCLTEFENGGHLNRDLVKEIVKFAGLKSDALDNLSDAQCITLIEEIRPRTLEANEHLDDQFGEYGQECRRLEERREIIQSAKIRLEGIYNDQELDDDEKLEAVRALSTEVGITELHKISTQAQATDTKQIMDEAYSKDGNRFIETFDLRPVF